MAPKIPESIVITSHALASLRQENRLYRRRIQVKAQFEDLVQKAKHVQTKAWHFFNYREISCTKEIDEEGNKVLRWTRTTGSDPDHPDARSPSPPISDNARKGEQFFAHESGTTCANQIHIQRRSGE